MNRVKTVKSKDFSVIDNKIFRNASLSLKAKGLLCTMLSFADYWDLSISRLSRFCKCGKTQIKTALDEIVKEGYLVKDKQIRDENGKFAGYEWILVDEPFSFDSSKSNENATKMCDLPRRKIRDGKSVTENRTQININQQVSTNKYQSSITMILMTSFKNQMNDSKFS